ncbi:DUF2956 family protein [Methylobacter sp. YRD-M1]|uniref:DUF2956 family protein n=1 Tax=Methylobacter sp. YRD-M1 TaxID=2911520 RepID=UPI00227A2319|nr:DUF2956 family protein [Methylobacter sp. YRD-M1]WAK01457.1 DUF2956 family protein [Methylobacter sp. YRD-M1]
MSKQNCQKPSLKIQNEAVQKTRRERLSSQIKLIVQGIRKGIDLHKKRQKGSTSGLNGKLKKASSQHVGLAEPGGQQMPEPLICQPRWLAYFLLVLKLSWWLIILAWIGIGFYLLI